MTGDCEATLRTDGGDDRSLQEQIRDNLLVKTVKCKNCDMQPVVGWKDGNVHLVCRCGSREIPDGVVPNHEWMPDDADWTVVEK